MSGRGNANERSGLWLPIRTDYDSYREITGGEINVDHTAATWTFQHRLTLHLWSNAFAAGCVALLRVPQESCTSTSSCPRVNVHLAGRNAGTGLIPVEIDQV